MASNLLISGSFSAIQGIKAVFVLTSVPVSFYTCYCRNHSFTSGIQKRNKRISVAHNILQHSFEISFFPYTRLQISGYSEFGLFWTRGIMCRFKASCSFRILVVLHDAFFSNCSKSCERLIITILPHDPVSFWSLGEVRSSKALMNCLKIRELSISKNLSFIT